MSNNVSEEELSEKSFEESVEELTEEESGGSSSSSAAEEDEETIIDKCRITVYLESINVEMGIEELNEILLPAIGEFKKMAGFIHAEIDYSHKELVAVIVLDFDSIENKEAAASEIEKMEGIRILVNE